MQFVMHPKVHRQSGAQKFDYTKGLLEGLKDSVVRKADYYSIYFKNLNKDVDGQSLALKRDTISKKPFGLKAVNIPLFQLYVFAYSAQLNGFEDSYLYTHRNNRILIETAHPLDLRVPAEDSLMDEWQERNMVSYEMRQPLNNDLSVEEAVRKDLERYTPFTASFENKEMKCWVLSRTSEEDKLRSTDLTAVPYSGYENSSFIIRNSPLWPSLIRELTNSFSVFSYPVLDETGYKGLVDMRLEPGFRDADKLQAQLKKYDLQFELMPRKITVLVIRDKRRNGF